jgi:hypothetical protein
MNGFSKMQERLGRDGWFVGWNLPCCQTCAWEELNWIDVEDNTKVLFNHSQDCEVEGSEEECPVCNGEGVVEGVTGELDEDCLECRGTGYMDFGRDVSDYDTSIGGFVCNSPEQQNSSLFCFDGSEEGVENLKAIVPIIEECGCMESFDRIQKRCEVNWNETGDSRIEISW